MPVLTSRICSSSGGRVAGRLGLDDPLDAAVGVAHDAAVAGRVVEDRRGHRRRGVGGAWAATSSWMRRGGDERHVAVEHDDGLSPASSRQRGEHRAAGAVRAGWMAARAPSGSAASSSTFGRADDHDRLGARLLGGEDRPGDQRPPADLVQDLGRGGLHPRALSGGHHDGAEGGHGAEG